MLPSAIQHLIIDYLDLTLFDVIELDVRPSRQHLLRTAYISLDRCEDDDEITPAEVTTMLRGRLRGYGPSEEDVMGFTSLLLLNKLPSDLVIMELCMAFTRTSYKIKTLIYPRLLPLLLCHPLDVVEWIMDYVIGDEACLDRNSTALDVILRSYPDFLLGLKLCNVRQIYTHNRWFYDIYLSQWNL